jgi:hypothetical protein
VVKRVVDRIETLPVTETARATMQPAMQATTKVVDDVVAAVPVPPVREPVAQTTGVVPGLVESTVTTLAVGSPTASSPVPGTVPVLPQLWGTLPLGSALPVVPSSLAPLAPEPAEPSAEVGREPPAGQAPAARIALSPSVIEDPASGARWPWVADSATAQARAEGVGAGHAERDPLLPGAPQGTAGLVAPPAPSSGGGQWQVDAADLAARFDLHHLMAGFSRGDPRLLPSLFSSEPGARPD